jgi:signal peptidase I
MMTVAFVVLLAALVARERYQLAIVAGDSMLPNLRSGALLVVDKRAYQHDRPKRGDVVVAQYSGGLVVKRIVGLPGEAVEVRQGLLYIDGTPRAESYDVRGSLLNVAGGTLGESEYATLGDNRGVPSSISVHPIVSRRDLVGKVVAQPGKLLRASFWLGARPARDCLQTGTVEIGVGKPSNRPPTARAELARSLMGRSCPARMILASMILPNPRCYR